MISRSGTLFQPRRLFLASGGVLRPQSGSVDMSSLHIGMPHMGFAERGNGKVNLDPAFRSTKYIDRGPGVRSNFKTYNPCNIQNGTSMHELYVHGA